MKSPSGGESLVSEWISSSRSSGGANRTDDLATGSATGPELRSGNGLGPHAAPAEWGVASDTGDAEIRAAYIDDAKLHLAAARELRELLEASETVTTRIIDAVAAGAPPIDAIRREDVAERRPTLSDAIRYFERIRHRARLRLIVVGLEEDMTVHDGATG